MYSATLVYSIMLPLVVGCTMLCASVAWAQLLPAGAGGAARTLPSSADVTRTAPAIDRLEQNLPAASTIIPDASPSNDIPEGLDGVTITLKSVQIQGMTAFDSDDMRDIYGPSLGKTIPLATVWEFAGAITERYRNQEYFLSRAFVPMQEIKNGKVTIRVVEGYIGHVSLDHQLTNNYLLRRQIARLTAQKPIKASQLESFMLQLNDLPGASFFGALKPLKSAPEGAVELGLKHTDNHGRGSVYIDNAGSRYLGPYQAGISYEGSIIPLHKTAINVAGSLGNDELRSASINHQIPLYPQWKMEFYSSVVDAEPGSSLSNFELRSGYTELGLGLQYQPIRQYLENLTFGLRFDGKNTNGDIFKNTALTRDRIRALRSSVQYDVSDGLEGYNYIQFGLDRGVDIMGASQAGDANLSRSEAKPDFTVGTFSYTRFQALPRQWMLTAQGHGQYASKPLYSAEEFGYGGQSFGRAYDPSEIVGDHGLAGMLELRYQGFDAWNDLKFAPYGFYDIGKVWNEDAGSEDGSGSSAGLGVYINHTSGLSSNLGIAFPLTRSVDNPLYGNGKSPRITVQMKYGF